MNKTGKIILAIIGILAFFSAFAKPKDINAFRNIKTTSVRMPFYKGTKLESFLRGRSAVMRGNFVDVAWPMIDAIRDGVEGEEIAKSDSSVEVYPLDSPLETVLKYWAERSYSEGVVVSESATIDRNSKNAWGKEKVFLRSPMGDINAVGFSVNLKDKFIKFNSQVEIVLRRRGDSSSIVGGKASESRKSDGKKDEISVTRAYCNEMTVDDERKVSLPLFFLPVILHRPSYIVAVFPQLAG